MNLLLHLSLALIRLLPRIYSSTKYQWLSQVNRLVSEILDNCAWIMKWVIMRDTVLVLRILLTDNTSGTLLGCVIFISLRLSITVILDYDWIFRDCLFLVKRVLIILIIMKILDNRLFISCLIGKVLSLYLFYIWLNFWPFILLNLLNYLYILGVWSW